MVFHRDLTLPILSIFSGKVFSSTIRKCLGLHDIRDCWINFFCISCSVSSPYTSDTIRVHRKGMAWKYVRASMTVVGYLPPMYDQGELLVDGGYVNNLPSDEMQKLGCHTIIGVDVEDKDESMYADIHPLQVTLDSIPFLDSDCCIKLLHPRALTDPCSLVSSRTM